MRRFGTISSLPVVLFAVAVLISSLAQAQTFSVLHAFTGGQDGANPSAGLTLDKGGNLYGTAQFGGTGDGTVFQLKHNGSGWVFNLLFAFNLNDGSAPIARVVFGPDGSLYGTTYGGGGCVDNDCGVVFKLTPYPTACKTAACPWKETVLYAFMGASDGSNPGFGDLLFDQSGNLYGTTTYGGYLERNCSLGVNPGCGVVFKLMPSNGGWTESVLYTFYDGYDGARPFGGVVFGPDGNLYGTTVVGGLFGMNCNYFGCGTVFGLGPDGVYPVYLFTGGSGGATPVASPILDQSGNLYGSTISGGTGSGTVFELTPYYPGQFNVLYNQGTYGSLMLDASGNLYGSTWDGGAYGYGSVFKLTPTPAPPWTYTSLHDFTGGTDGAYPQSNVVFDSSGNLYGTTSYGGDPNCNNVEGCGVVWKITP